MYAKSVAIVSAALLLAACSLNRQDYETTPVVVETEAGPLTCQLYKHDLVIWDRATIRPASLDLEAADALCLEEGQRRKDAGTGADEPVTLEEEAAAL